MNWKKEAENELREYGCMKEAIISIPEMIQNIKEDIATIRGARFDGEPVRGGTNKREDWLVDQINKKTQLDMKMEILKKRMVLVDRGLLSVTREERRILELFYIERPKDYIDRLCDELGYEQSNLYYHKDIALRKFTLAVYGVIDT